MAESRGHQHQKNRLPIALILAMLLLVFWPMPIANATSSEVQVGGGHNSPPSTSFSVAFGKSVTSGDLLVALVGTYTTGLSYSISDSQNNHWTPGISDCTNYCVQIFYTQATSSAADTVTFSATSDPSSDYIYGFIAEFSGTSYLGKASTGTSGSCPSVTSITPESGSAVVGIASVIGGGWSHGSGYSMIGSSTGWYTASEWAANWGGSSTTAPWSAPCSVTFDEVAESFAATGTYLITCATGSGPKGILVSGSNVWIAESSAGNVGLSSTSTCFTRSYVGKNDPTYIGAFGNGYLAFTQKTASNSCISTWNPSTKAVTASYCAGSKVGFDDVSTDPTSSSYVWATEYYGTSGTNGALVKYSYTGSATINAIPYSSHGCTGSNPEGVRVDSSGNVWVADETTSCGGPGPLWKFVPSTGTWTSYFLDWSGTSVMPWFLAYDGTNGLLWLTSRNYQDCSGSNCVTGAVFSYTISSGAVQNIHQPSYYQPSGYAYPLGIAVDPSNDRVYVAFQGGSFAEYYTGSSPVWLCNRLTGGGSTDQDWDVSFQSPNFFWGTMYGSNAIAYGVC